MESTLCRVLSLTKRENKLDFDPNGIENKKVTGEWLSSFETKRCEEPDEDVSVTEQKQEAKMMRIMRMKRVGWGGGV